MPFLDDNCKLFREMFSIYLQEIVLSRFYNAPNAVVILFLYQLTDRESKSGQAASFSHPQPGVLPAVGKSFAGI